MRYKLATMRLIHSTYLKYSLARGYQVNDVLTRIISNKKFPEPPDPEPPPPSPKLKNLFSNTKKRENWEKMRNQICCYLKEYYDERRMHSRAEK